MRHVNIARTYRRLDARQAGTKGCAKQILRSAPVPVLLVRAPRAEAVAPAASRVAAKA
ncbi:hypothetical protein WIX39_028430 [Variovorax sp. AB1(2024)]|uniref:hypothetical protein n=1 Tax=Variovorax sp. AB1(2024) TaxID=3132214 RepID=UPI0030A6E836